MPSQSVDPRTGVAFGPVIPDDTVGEVRDVCLRAFGASAAWGSTSKPARAAMLRAAADALDAAGEQLIPLADQESGLGIPRLTGELARTTFQIRTFADAVEDGSFQEVIIDAADDRPVPVGHPDLRRMLVPLGPVAVFGASNFPFAFSVAGGDTASALAAGCPTPRTQPREWRRTSGTPRRKRGWPPWAEGRARATSPLFWLAFA